MKNKSIKWNLMMYKDRMIIWYSTYFDEKIYKDYNIPA